MVLNPSERDPTFGAWLLNVRWRVVPLGACWPAYERQCRTPSCTALIVLNAHIRYALSMRLLFLAVLRPWSAQTAAAYTILQCTTLVSRCLLLYKGPRAFGLSLEIALAVYVADLVSFATWDEKESRWSIRPLGISPFP